MTCEGKLILPMVCYSQLLWGIHLKMVRSGGHRPTVRMDGEAGYKDGTMLTRSGAGCEKVHVREIEMNVGRK